MKTCNNPSGKCLHELRGLEGKHSYVYLILLIKKIKDQDEQDLDHSVYEMFIAEI